MRVLLTLLWLSCATTAMGTDPSEGQEASRCLSEILDTFQAEIVGEAEAIESSLNRIKKMMGSLSPDATSERKEWIEAIADIDTLIRNLGWSPEGLDETHLTATHLAQREAAHDLKNVLQIALMSAQETAASVTSNELKSAINGVTTNIDIALKLVRFLKTKQAPPKKVFSVQILFSEIAKSLRGLPSRYNLALSQPPVGVAIYGSRLEIGRIVHNLVLNAVEAMPDGGDIRIFLSSYAPGKYPKRLDGILDPNKAYLGISIEDNGPGVPKEKLASLFSSTHGVASSKEQKGKNVRGIGISSVTSLAERNEGVINIENADTGGVRFELYFEKIDREMTEALKKELEVEPEEGMVLIVDDDRMMRAMLPRILEKSSVPVRAFSHSLTLIEYFKRHRDKVRAIIIDQYLGDGSTLEMNIEALRQIGTTTPIFLCSGDKPHGNLDIQGSLLKPFNYEDFLKLLDQYETEE